MLRLFIAAIAIVMAVGVARAERRVALVIGEDDYKSIRKLDNAVADAQAVGDMLQKLGFEVTLETDRNLKRTRRALEDFREDGAGADVALVYYAGHGVEIAGDNRLLPTDADASSLDALKASTLPLEEVRETVARIAKVGLVMLDACRNDPFGTGKPADGGDAPVAGKQDDATGRDISPTNNGGGSRSALALASAEVVEKARPGLGRLGRAEGILFAFSAAPGETAADGADGHSPFAQALVKYLGTDGLEVRSALTLVQQEVYDLSRGRQLPYVESGLPSLFFAATTKEQLPERERLLLAMADITPDLRAEVELVAAKADMPLAPLYGALISADLASATDQDRLQKLAEAANAYAGTREAMRKLASEDPQVEKLRSAAEQDLALGAFDKARASLAAAAGIDAQSGEALAANLVKRRLSEAATHAADAGVAWTQLDYPAAIAALEQAAALHDKIEDEDVPDAARAERDRVLEKLGQIYDLSGNAGKALDAYQRMRAAAELRISKGGDDTDAARDLAISHQKIGDVRRTLGDLTGAVSAYQACLEIRTRLAAAAPGDADALHALSIIYQHIGSIRRDQGDIADALAAYQADFEIAAGLAARNPDDARVQLDLAASRTMLGETRQARGDLDGALAEYRASLALRVAVAKSNPANPEWQRELSVGYERIGDALLLRGDLDGAAGAFAAGRDIVEKLAARDPGDTELQRNLGLGHVKLGDVAFERRDLTSALASYEAGRTVILRLVGLDGENGVWQRDLSISLNKVASVLVEQGDLAGALTAYQQSLAIRTRLAGLDPSNMQAQSDLSFVHDRIGNTMRAQGDMQGALAEFTASADIVAQLAASDPRNAKWQSDLSDGLARVAAILDAMGEPDAALDRYRASFEIAKRLAASDPSNVGWQIDYIITSVNLAEHGDKPAQRYKDALEVALRLQKEGRLTAAKAWIVDDLKSRLDKARKVAR